MEIEKDKKDLLLNVKVIGKLNTSTSTELVESLKDDFADINDLILDFSELEYISSAGLRVLALFQENMNNINGTMKVINIKPAILKILEVSGFVEVLTIE